MVQFDHYYPEIESFKSIFEEKKTFIFFSSNTKDKVKQAIINLVGATISDSYER